MMTLFEECINAIGEENLEILSDKSTESYFDRLCDLFPVLPWARIDWDKISRKKKISDLNDIGEWLKNMGIYNDEVIILWNYTEISGIRTNLKEALNVIEDVIAVGSDTFMLCENEGYVIEFFHDGEITVGITESK
ncbi:hypothetical protein [Bacillus kexueae]|uniref:CDI toxin immunity protein n=1 Tax=Aeribacillus kexueae TaxID=2078952 RepID=UPI001FAF94C9|nr:hypothetical protein [Bacillus kexueae]